MGLSRDLRFSLYHILILVFYESLILSAIILIDGKDSAHYKKTSINKDEPKGYSPRVPELHTLLGG